MFVYFILSFGFICIDAKNNICNIDLGSGKIVNKVEDFYVSYCIDSKMFDPEVHWEKFDFKSPKLQTLMKSLSPSILRIGGSPADYLFFDLPVNIMNASGIQPLPYVITKQDVTNLLELTSATNAKLLFDFNVQTRYGYNWDPSNAIQLLEFAAHTSHQTQLLFELGNEPDCLIPELITPERLGQDFVILDRVLKYYQSFKLYNDSFIVGPDVVSGNELELKFIRSVIDKMAGNLGAVTFHHYYFRGDVATYKDYLNPDNFDSLAFVINNVKGVISKSKYPTVDMWIGETSDAWHSGTPNVSDRFISAFLWLEKLGLSASMGVKVVMRQTLYGYYYSLLDLDMNPNPDYWLSWLHKLLVGQSVLSLKLSCDAIENGDMHLNDVINNEDVNKNRDDDDDVIIFKSPLQNKKIPHNPFKYAAKNKDDDDDKKADVKISTRDKNTSTLYYNNFSDFKNKSNSLKTFRFYAHCTKKSTMYNAGGITLFGINMHPTQPVDIKFNGVFTNLDRHVYLMEPDNDYEDDDESGDDMKRNIHKDIPVLSKFCKLNGKRLKMMSDTVMPPLNPVHQTSNQPFTLPPLTYAYIVFYDAKYTPCL